MDSNLQAAFVQLSSLQGTSSLSEVEKIVLPVVGESVTHVIQFLSQLNKMTVDRLVYCQVVEFLCQRTSEVLQQLSVQNTFDSSSECQSATNDHVSDKSFAPDFLISVLIPTYSTVIKHLHECAEVGTLATEEDALSDSRIDFSKFSSLALSAMRSYEIIINFLGTLEHSIDFSDDSCGLSNARKNALRLVVVKSLLVCLEHREVSPWSCAESISQAECLLGVICHVSCCSSSDLLLTGTRSLSSPSSSSSAGYLDDVLAEVLPRLSTKTWQLNPSMPFVFSYCLHSVCMPLLSDYLPMFLPPTVIFVDDHQPEICLLGIRCMQHIINNCSRAELRWFGRADVIYDSLWRAFIGCNKVNLDPLIACLLSALNVIEESPKARTGGKLLYDSHHDKLMNRYLANMEMEDGIANRRTYSRNLVRLIDMLGVTVVRHLQRLIKVIEMYLEISDGPDETCRFNLLDVLYVVLNQAWPRIPGHADSIMKSLVRLLHDLAADETAATPAVVDKLKLKALDCVGLLRKICPEYDLLDDKFFQLVCAKVVY